MEITRLHYQRGGGGFDFLKKHSLARNLSSSVSTWEGWDEVSDCHSSLCSWCMSQEAQRSTAAASSFFFLRGGSLTLSSVLSEAPKTLSWVIAETDSVGGFLSAWMRDTWCPSYTGSIVLTGRTVYRVYRVWFICRRLLTCTLSTHIHDICRNL